MGRVLQKGFDFGEKFLIFSTCLMEKQVALSIREITR
jgi:hypothetical protein